MLDFGPHFRLRAVSRPLCLTQWPMAMRFGLDETLGFGGMLPEDIAWSAIRGIAPHPRLLAMQPLRQHLAVMHIRRRRRDRMNQFRLAVGAKVSNKLDSLDGWEATSSQQQTLSVILQYSKTS